MIVKYWASWSRAIVPRLQWRCGTEYGRGDPRRMTLFIENRGCCQTRWYGYMNAGPLCPPHTLNEFQWRCRHLNAQMDCHCLDRSTILRTIFQVDEEFWSDQRPEHYRWDIDRYPQRRMPLSFYTRSSQSTRKWDMYWPSNNQIVSCGQ
jgi:hypothetical protein